MKKVVALGAALGVTIAGLALAAPANAEPVSNSFVLVGSDTLQDAGNALANGTSLTGSFVRVTAGGSTIGSFDAFPANTAVQTKPAGPYFGRPSGSGQGLSALSRSIDGENFANGGLTAKIPGQVDIARSSSGPNAAGAATGALNNNSGRLLFVPFGRDAVAYAYKLGTGATAPAGIDSLTTAQLTQVYNGSLTSIGGVTVSPALPQAGSGTRKFFLGAIGVSDTVASGVVGANGSAAENDARALAPAAGTVQIIPFSAASWIAQSNAATGVNTIAGSNVLLGSPNGIAPYTGSGSALVPNSAFYSAAPFGRDTYIVVEFARVDTTSPTYDANLANLIDPAKTTSLTNFGNSPASSGAVKKKFGFLAPSTTTTQRSNLF